MVMGMLVDGQWHNDPKIVGAFQRPETHFRDRPTADEPARHQYRLYASHACPWAHRCTIAHSLLGLEHFVEVHIVEPVIGERGWRLSDGGDLAEIYLQRSPAFTGRVTVPVLFDTRSERIVNNESREILEIFNDLFAPHGGSNFDLYPADRIAEVNATIDSIYEPINNGVYRCAFAGTQGLYDEAMASLFGRLEQLETQLQQSPFLCGATLTAADVCLFTTLLRFDAVYHRLFGCSLKRIADFPALMGFRERMLGTPGIAETVHFDHIAEHYYRSFPMPQRRIVPWLPELR